MTRGRDKPIPPLPWSKSVAVEKIPDGGSHEELTANAAQLAAMSEIAGLRGMSDARAVFDLSFAGRGRVHVTGRVSAKVAQTCVVTLEPIENLIDEPIDVLFAPADQVEAIIKAMEAAPETEEETPDPPEPIEGGAIDLGKLAADALFLGIDPYPRKPDAVFEPPAVEEDPDSHPFAALKALKDEPPKKPKS